MDAKEAIMDQSTRGAARPGVLKWGLGGLGAVGVGLAACSVACSVVIPLLLVLGLGTAAVSAVEAGADVAGKVLIVVGMLAIGLAGRRWWRQRRSCGCEDVAANAAGGGTAADLSPAEGEPIACTLDGRGVRQRLDEFRDAFERGYLGGERTSGGVRWRFRAAPELEANLRSLAVREQACCRFFRFDIRAIEDEIWWDTEVDNSEAQPILEEFFTLPNQLKGTVGDGAATLFWPGHTEPKSGQADTQPERTKNP
jgi:hypothetical protein